MPSCTQEMHDLMVKWFGPYDHDIHAMEFLYSHGYKLLPGWTWELPCESHTITCYEAACIWYLISEWDYGGLDKKHEPRDCYHVCGSETGLPCYA